jgi:cytochrome c-type biogenesis protein CcmH
MTGYRGLVRALLIGTVATSVAAAQAPALPAAPAGAPQDSGALRVQVQGTLSEAQKNDPKLEEMTKTVASELRCPVCQGLSIQDSPSELSQQMRTVVKEQLASGKSEQEVKDYFISKYGEWILLEPQPHGFNLLIYALPVLLVLGGAGFIVLLVKRWTAAPVAIAASGDATRTNDEIPE